MSVTPPEAGSEQPAPKKSIRFPARSFLAFALAPEAPVSDWLEALDRWTENSPGFFSGRPIVLDLNMMKPEERDVPALCAELLKRGIRIYAIEAHGVDSLDPELPPLLKGARPIVVDEPVAPSPAELEEAAKAEEAADEAEEIDVASRTLIIDAPVRSGQSVFHPQGDVIVLGSVASGAEIVAGGSIHVYGALRGRVFAGVNGNDGARVFCRRNEAELISLNGWYRTAEEMEGPIWGKAVQAHLENGAVALAPLN